MPTATPSPKIRPPAVAESFYTASPGRLRAEVAGLLAEAPAHAGGRAKALIAPHAGYVYSGKVAATAFAALRDIAETVTRVVVIGPAHYVALRGIAVPTVEAFETPLGRVPVDREALAAIADLPGVIEADAPHTPEHALEVELPFLQVLLGDFALSRLRHRAAPRCRDRRDDRARRLGAAWRRRCLRLSAGCRPAGRGGAPRAWRATACVLQFGRYRGRPRSGGGLRRVERRAGTDTLSRRRSTIRRPLPIFRLLSLAAESSAPTSRDPGFESLRRYASLAQLAERLPDLQKARGSNP